jgi:serine/threonine protein kinase
MCCAFYRCSQSTKNPDLQRRRVLQELGSMLRVQHHPHAVRLLDAFEDSRSYQLVMPMLKGEVGWGGVACGWCF